MTARVGAPVSLQSAVPLALAALLALWLAADGRMTGDEPSYLYAAAYLELPQLLAAELQPSGIPGFLQGRILHLLFLKGVMAASGDPATGLRVLQGLHLGIVLLNVVLIGRIARALLPQTAEVRLATIAIGFTPISLYFAFKTTADNEALLAGLLATLALVRLAQGGRAHWIASGAFALAAAALLKNQMVFVPAAFWCAACLVPVAGLSRRRLAVRGTLCGALGAALTVALLAASGLGIESYLASYRAPFANVTPAAAKLMNLGTELGLAWLALPLALLSPRRRELGFFALWFAGSLAPFLFFSGVEPRHVAVNLAAAGGLIALAGEAVARRWPRALPGPPAIQAGACGVAAAALVAFHGLLLPIMPHKVDLDRLGGLLASLDARFGPGGYVLLPGNAYSDFYLLRVRWPDRDVRFLSTAELALSPARPRAALLHDYYDDRVRESLPQLTAEERPLVFFGFGTTLAAENLAAFLGRLSPALSARVLSQVDLVPHLFTPATAWLWDAPGVTLEPVAKSGAYQAFRVRLPPGA